MAWYAQKQLIPHQSGYVRVALGCHRCNGLDYLRLASQPMANSAADEGVEQPRCMCIYLDWH